MLKSEMSEKIEMLKTHFGTTNHEKNSRPSHLDYENTLSPLMWIKKLLPLPWRHTYCKNDPAPQQQEGQFFN